VFAAVSASDNIVVKTPASPLESQFLLRAVDDGERPAAEAFVQRVYGQAYGAQLQEFMPLLLERRCAQRTEAILGMRPGNLRAPLFLEHYLDQPVEQVIAGRSACPVARTDIVEIGNLAAGRRGASPLLFLIMAAALDAAHFRWLAFTATPQVAKLVARLQYRPLALSDVDPARIGAELARWGRYYETRPRVMCVPLAEALSAARRNVSIDATLTHYRGVIAELARQLRGDPSPMNSTCGACEHD
jgi:hypothetical protein